MRYSKFTYRDLDLLRSYSPTSPLRVIALIDFDAFYAQCEIVRLGLPPTTPLAVQQWNAIIALNYPARDYGLRRGMPAEDAKKLCPEIVLQHVATWREGETTWAYRPDWASNMSRDKSALDPYRHRSRQCFEFIRSLLPPEPLQRVEKASIDEVFLDLSAQVHNILTIRFPQIADPSSDLRNHLPLPEQYESLVYEDDNVIDLQPENDGFDWDNVALNIGATIVRNIRAEVSTEFGYTCSAGIARNKILAKLGAGHKKPDHQTVIHDRAAENFLSQYEFTKIRGLGRKLGLQVSDAFGLHRVSDLVQVSLSDLQKELGEESGYWVYNVIRGKETSVVKPRIAVQSMLSAKTFVPSVVNFDQALKWLRIFAADLMGRMNELNMEYSRRPTVIAVHHHINGRFGPTRTKQASIALGSTIDEESLFSWSKVLLRKLSDEARSWPCASLSVSVTGFQELVTHNRRITSFFKKVSSSPLAELQSDQGSEGKRPEDKASVPKTDTCNTYKCPTCSRDIEASSVLEHLDFHEAVKLQRLIN